MLPSPYQVTLKRCLLLDFAKNKDSCLKFKTSLLRLCATYSRTVSNAGSSRSQRRSLTFGPSTAPAAATHMHLLQQQR